MRILLIIRNKASLEDFLGRPLLVRLEHVTENSPKKNTCNDRSITMLVNVILYFTPYFNSSSMQINEC